ncbi:FMN-linked oxidoreductase [Calocera cornea HHB12733]|uniref:FMN-linked oxidoreductase n=1 Tax=Calocera cornea HHB12733 TaxID=1353952 RepID=A0A165CXD5_9BASI|nr:FMN-linked oxidoreductase [Calocera cornea HHB12733]
MLLKASFRPAIALPRPTLTAYTSMRHSPPSRSPSPMAKRMHIESDNAEAGPSSTSSWTRMPVNYGKGMHLAPMVRSGTMPTRLLALEAGAELVWSPETVDRALIGCERTVDPVTGVISYSKTHRPVFTMHPVERSRLIFQIGSSNAELAAEAAKMVYQDVAGIDLNCGCPKHFSVHAGMGAGLLQNPDNLCAILKSIRAAVPAEVPVSCKIRMLPSQDDTLALVRQIVDTGVISCLTVHCRTPPMRDRDAALIHRLRDIVDAVGSKVVVVENGDCTDCESAEKIRQATGVTAVMVARAAEANPTCFSADGPRDAETYVIPRYARLAKYLDHHWSNTKFCLMQLTSSSPALGKRSRAQWKAALATAKSYEELVLQWEKDINFLEGGAEILEDITQALNARSSLVDSAQVTSDPTVDTAPMDTAPTSLSTGGPAVELVDPVTMRKSELQAVF